MKAPLSKAEYPRYYSYRNALLAFTGPSEMYKIEAVGSNPKNEGISIDHYITRKMVIKHYPGDYVAELARSEFKQLIEKLFSAYFNKILILCDDEGGGDKCGG